MRAPLWPPRLLSRPGPGVLTEGRWPWHTGAVLPAHQHPAPRDRFPDQPWSRARHTHLVRVRAILVRHDFRLPVTHQLYLWKGPGSGSPPSTTPWHSTLSAPPREPPQPSPPWSTGHREPHLEVVQELCRDCVWRPNHYFRHVLWGQGHSWLAGTPPGWWVAGDGPKGQSGLPVRRRRRGEARAGYPPAPAQPASPALTRQASTLSVRSCRFMMG